MSVIPPNAPKPQDHLKPVAQREAEAEKTVTVEWRDMSFEVLSDPDAWPVELTLAFEEGKAASGVRGMLGPKQWSELMDMKPRNRDLGDLFQAIAKACGFEDAGNS